MISFFWSWSKLHDHTRRLEGRLNSSFATSSLWHTRATPSLQQRPWSIDPSSPHLAITSKQNSLPDLEGALYLFPVENHSLRLKGIYFQLKTAPCSKSWLEGVTRMTSFGKSRDETLRFPNLTPSFPLENFEILFMNTKSETRDSLQGLRGAQ